ncbi:unnamed protein product, partial [Mesorhabditis belari]|uniref:Uncharacterized protein n=1 Tax=Mesorhabditis belari TaxID=2138241 RepID=A0AAF3FCZ4_9BILA
MLSSHFCCLAPQSPQFPPQKRQFFETIAPREGFADDEALEVYIHDRSRKIEPKDATKLVDVKPKHSPQVLKSPGIKPPKGNHYAKEHPATSATHLLPPTPSPRDHDGSKPSPSKTNNEDFAIIDINPGQLPRYIGDVTRRQAPTTSSFPLGPVPKKAPPPLHPRKTRQPVSNGPPIRSPSVFTPVSASWKPPAPSPPELANKSPRLNQHAQAFIFPEIPMASGSPTPQRPAKAPAPPPPPTVAQSSTSAEHRVTLPVPSSPNGDSPSVSVSLPPPSLPPRASRPGSITSVSSPLPPPRPPKPGHMTASPLTTPRSLAPSTTSQSQSTTIAATTKPLPTSTSISSESPSNPNSPPPLPPKTYKSRRQSSSPTS